jgi:hypothetical protein
VLNPDRLFRNGDKMTGYLELLRLDFYFLTRLKTHLAFTYENGHNGFTVTDGLKLLSINNGIKYGNYLYSGRNITILNMKN